MKRIVIVGGGAGGLELVTQLADKLGKKQRAEIVLVDKSRTHVWKPLLHEVAAGVIDKYSDGVDYRMHAVKHRYRFELGEMSGIDTVSQTLTLNALNDQEGHQILPSRTLTYDFLVMALGSQSNDFGTPGVKENCYFLDSLKQAERFHKALLNQLLKINNDATDHRILHVAIVGGGATGTELAAQLYHVANLARAYGMPEMSSKRIKVSIIEADKRILPALPERIANSARKALVKLGVDVLENTRVASASETGFETADGERIEADLLVWSAGVKAPDFLTELDIFETNRINQILVKPSLQSTRFANILAIGDCCGFRQADNSWVPPRAQSAHQMAAVAGKNLLKLIKNEKLESFRYRDYGSLVHLSRYSTVGSLMGSLSNNSMFIEGRLAKLVYVSLYNMHQFAIHGYVRGIVVLLSRKLGNIVGMRLKLH